MTSKAHAAVLQRRSALLSQLVHSLLQDDPSGEEHFAATFRAAEVTLDRHAFAEVNPRVVQGEVQAVLGLFCKHSQHGKQQAVQDLINR
jgi:hypothetical protein